MRVNRQMYFIVLSACLQLCSKFCFPDPPFTSVNSRERLTVLWISSEDESSRTEIFKYPIAGI